jgi:hypothetical protein
MPDESDYKDYKSIEDYGKSMEGSRYFHSLYLKAVNHPIRREILTIISKKEKISKSELMRHLMEKNIVDDESVFQYNIDFLKKALCLEIEELENETYYKITQEGRVIDYL